MPLTIGTRRAAWGAAAPAAALPLLTRHVASHCLMPGFNGGGLSNGTDTGQNYRSMHFNESGKALSNLALVYVGWLVDTVSESAGANAVTVRAAIEYPNGTFTPVTFAGVRDLTLGASALVTSDSAAVAIPAAAQFWVRTYLTVASGLKWARGYQPVSSSSSLPGGSVAAGYGAASALELCEVGTGTVDKTTSGTIVHTAGSRGFGPAAIVSTDTGLRAPLCGLGDSIMAGAGDGLFDNCANTGFAARAASTRRPFIHGAVSGTQAQAQVGKLALRAALCQACGVVDVIHQWGHNDVGAGRIVAQVQADLTSNWSALSGAGLRVLQTTITPRTTTTDAWKTVANQTVYATNGGFTGGASSRRALVNAWIRTLPGPLFAYAETADAAEPARDDGRWIATAAYSAHLTSTGANTDAATADGQHPNVTSSGGTNPEYGGAFALRDALVARLAAL